MSKVKRYSGERFGKLILVSPAGEPPNSKWSSWLCQCDCGNTKTINTTNLLTGNTNSCGCLLSECKLGPKNPRWKGNKVGYSGVHAWIRERYVKPEFCERCYKVPPRDLANKSGKYIRDLGDWWYLCRRCHMESDGRNQQLRDRGKSRKIKIPPCLYCGKSYYRKSGQRTAKFCSRKCYFKSGGRWRKEASNNG